MKKVALLIDGGHLRTTARQLGYRYNNDFVEEVARHCHRPEEEELFRILYYDCAPYQGTKPLPISGQEHDLTRPDSWISDLAKRPMFAVRLGVLKFRGWKPKKTPLGSGKLSDSDFVPDFEQKGVDMRIGLDIAVLAASRAVERVILITADTDFVPAMKHGRRAGLQIVVIRLPRAIHNAEFLAHVDFERTIKLPTVASSEEPEA